MKVIITTVAFGDSGNIDIPIGIELTRRNLQALLAKLDEPESAYTLIKDGFWVWSVKDEDHYTGRPAGLMSPTTESTIKRMRESGAVKCA